MATDADFDMHMVYWFNGRSWHKSIYYNSWHAEQYAKAMRMNGSLVHVIRCNDAGVKQC